MTDKEKSSPANMGEDQGRWEETGEHHQRISRYRGIGMYEKCSSELERPYLPPKGKEGIYKSEDEVMSLARGSQRG